MSHILQQERKAGAVNKSFPVSFLSRSLSFSFFFLQQGFSYKEAHKLYFVLLTSKHTVDPSRLSVTHPLILFYLFNFFKRLTGRLWNEAFLISFPFFVAAELPELFHLSVSWYNYGSLVLFVIHLRWILYNVMACLRATDPTGILSGHLSSVSLCSSSTSTSRGRGTSGWKGSHPELFKGQKQSQPHQNKTNQNESK